MSEFPIIDGHNDTLLRLHEQEPSKEHSFFEESLEGHIDYPRAVKGGLGGGFFAVFTPNPGYHIDPHEHMTEKGCDIPLSSSIDHDDAIKTTNALASQLFQLESDSKGTFKVVQTAAELRDCLQNEVLASICHIEGAEAIDPEFNALDVLYQAGLRSLGIVWSRPNIFGEGVPFRYPSSPDIGSGLT